MAVAAADAELSLLECIEYAATLANEGRDWVVCP